MAITTVRDRPSPSRRSWRARGSLVLTVLTAIWTWGCNAEKRDVGPTPPSSPPTRMQDRRQRLYDANHFEQAEGGRLFRWSGCDQCHTETSAGFVNLTDKSWRRGGSTPAIYQTIATGGFGMPSYGMQLTAQELWQVAGYVASLNKMKPEMRRRSAAAQQGEPSGATWQGALR